MLPPLEKDQYHLRQVNRFPFAGIIQWQILANYVSNVKCYNIKNHILYHLPKGDLHAEVSMCPMRNTIC